MPTDATAWFVYLGRDRFGAITIHLPHRATAGFVKAVAATAGQPPIRIDRTPVVSGRPIEGVA